MPGGQTVGHVGGKAAPHDVVHAEFDFVVEAERRGFGGVEDAALAGVKLDRAERPFVRGE